MPDQNGLPRVIVDKEGVTLAGKSGNRRACMLFNPDTDDPEFILCEDNGNVRANFFIDKGNIPRLIIRDHQGEPRAVLTLDEAMFERVMILDELGHPEFVAP